MKTNLKILFDYERVLWRGKRRESSKYVCVVRDGGNWGTPEEGYEHAIWQLSNSYRGEVTIKGCSRLRFLLDQVEVTFWQAYDQVDETTKAILLREWYPYVEK